MIKWVKLDGNNLPPIYKNVLKLEYNYTMNHYDVSSVWLDKDGLWYSTEGNCRTRVSQPTYWADYENSLPINGDML